MQSCIMSLGHEISSNSQNFASGSPVGTKKVWQQASRGYRISQSTVTFPYLDSLLHVPYPEYKNSLANTRCRD